MAGEPEEKANRPFRWLRVMVWFLGAVTLFYCVVLFVLFLFENQLVYLPSSAQQFWREPEGYVKEDIMLPLDDGTKIHAWWCPKDEAKSVMLIAHGNAGNLSHRSFVVPLWQSKLDASVVMFDYPGYGKSEGSPTESGCYESGEVVYNWLVQEKKLSPKTIVFFGRSLGSGIMTYLATKHDHKALVLSSPFTSLPDAAQRLYPYFPVRLLMRNRFPNLSRVSQCRSPIFLIHGEADSLIPISHSEKLYSAANEPKKFVRLAWHDHNHVMPEEVYEEVAEFLENHAEK
ncbi:MAG: alpha/beta hydrolase [Gemmataceae bacterium]